MVILGYSLSARYYIHMKRPSALDKDCNYYMFRDQLVPAWEVGSRSVLSSIDFPQWRLLDFEGEENFRSSG